MTSPRSSRGFLQRFLVLFVPCAALLAGLVLWFDAVDQRSERTLLEQSEGLAIALAHTALAHEFQEVVADVRLLADSAELQWFLQHPQQRPDRLSAEYLALSRYRRLYDQVRFLDAAGMEIVRVDFNNGRPAAVPKAELQSRRTRSYFSETLALAPGAVFVSPFERHIEHEQVEHPDQPMIGFGTPVVDRQGRKRGIVLLNYDGTEFFAALARATAPAIGKVVLLNLEGAWLRGPRLENEWGSAVSGQTFAEAFPAVWTRIRGEETGQFTTPDGLFTFTTIHPLAEAEAETASTTPVQPVGPRTTARHPPAHEWKLVSRVAPAVLGARLHRSLQGILPLALLVFGGLAVGTAVLARVGIKHAQAEKALQASERRLRELLDTVPLVTMTLNPSGRITYVNEHLCQLTGWAATDLIGRDWSTTVLTADTPDLVHTLLRGAMTAGEIPRYNEYRIRSQDGRQHLIAWANAVLRDPHGHVTGMASFGRDITEHRAADVALAESEERFRAAVDAFPAEFVIYDAERRLKYINGFGRRMTARMGVSEPLGRRDEEIFPPEFTAGFLPHLERAYATREAEQFEWTQPAAFGGRTLIVHYVPLLANGESVRQMLGIVHDITARKQAEEALRQAQKLEAVGRLAGGVAHDFNNILTAVLARLDDLQADPTLSTTLQAELAEIERDALRAAALIRQLLVFSRRQVATMKPLEMNHLLVNLLKMLYRVLGEHIRVEFSADPTELWVTGDAGMLEQVVTNLAVNARDAMPQGGRLTIRTQRVTLDADATAGEPGARPGTFVCLTVADTGCGMDAAILPRIFEPFFTTKEVGRGTGLGLATVYGIVAQHRGWISVESHIGQGSIFRVFLPLEATQPPVPEDAAVRSSLGGRETLLLVEDEPTVRKPMAAALRRLGYQVLEASSGPEALAIWAVQRDDIAVLISDVVMPEGLTGVELASRLVAERPALQVILASGYSEELAQSGGRPMAGVTYLAKPFRPSDIAQAVRACLEQQEGRLERAP